MGNQCVQGNRSDRKKKQTCQQVLQVNLPASPSTNNSNKVGKENIPEEGLNIAKPDRQTIIDLNETQLYCLICKDKYNDSNRMPMIICQENHTICQNCKQMLLATKVERYKICPLCKRILNRAEMRVNQELREKIV